MAKGVTVELNFSGVRELMQSGEIQAIVNGAAEQAASAAGDLSGGLPYDVRSGVGKNRAWATVKPGSIHARNKDRKENILEKAKRGVHV